ncbi:MAG: IS1182 family transposase [Terriglobia bacterium]
MARFKPYDYSQMKFIPVSFKEQILPGSFEYTLNHLIDHEIDLGVFEHRYCNDETGAPAYDPAILLKVILYAYARGVTASRQIERLCRENVVFMALSADSAPHFTTIADFIARLDAEIVAVFRDVLLVCDELGLIGREMFAVDGVKLPSNASKSWSGTRAEFKKKVTKIERAVRYLVKRHREADERGEAGPVQAARERQIETLKRASRKVKAWLEDGEDKVGPSGRVKKSNITDNESAKMKTGKGVIQGYDGVSVVDAKHQVVVHAAAYGEAQEHGLLIPMLEGVRENFSALGAEDVLDEVAVAADAGFHSEANVRYLFETGVDGYLADTLFRKRDPRFATAGHHVPQRVSAPWARPKGQGLFRPRDFIYDKATQTCICPAGEFLYQNGSHCRIRGYEAVKFTGAKRVCGPCALRSKCLRHPDRTPVRQVVFFTGRTAGQPETYTAKMKRKIDTDAGRRQYGRRLAVAEPVFANISSTRGLRRFSLRGRRKVNTQWLLYCLVHNIGKVQRYGNLERRRRRTLQ